jgi:hypothetical protein
MSYPIQNNNFNPSPQAGAAFGQMFTQPQYDYLSVHNHRHQGIPHAGDRVITNDFVIRHQFGPDGDILGGMPEIHPRF